MATIKSNLRMKQDDTAFHVVDDEELRFQELKIAIHEKLVDSLDLSMLATVHESQLEKEVRLVAEDLCKEEAPQLKGDERERMLTELYHEVFGLGPLELLMQDDEITDILVNHPHEIYFERGG